MLRILSAILLILFAIGPAWAARTQDLSIETHRGTHHITVEVAESDAERETGLMFRKALAPDAGMLFLFPVEEPVAMWMKNTLIPLDMLFVRSNGSIAAIREQAVPQSLDIIRSGEAVSSVVELPGGTVQRLHIETGDRVSSKGIGEPAGR